jgi:transcriptional regulator with XRE-family HTH domain
MGRTGRREDFAVEFGSRVRARRLEREWTQERLAEEVGFHFTYVSSLERGERNVSLRNILKLAQALDTDAGELVSGIQVTD